MLFESGDIDHLNSLGQRDIHFFGYGQSGLFLLQSLDALLLCLKALLVGLEGFFAQLVGDFQAIGFALGDFLYGLGFALGVFFDQLVTQLAHGQLGFAGVGGLFGGFFGRIFGCTAVFLAVFFGLVNGRNARLFGGHALGLPVARQLGDLFCFLQRGQLLLQRGTLTGRHVAQTLVDQVQLFAHVGHFFGRGFGSANAQNRIPCLFGPAQAGPVGPLDVAQILGHRIGAALHRLGVGVLGNGSGLFGFAQVHGGFDLRIGGRCQKVQRLVQPLAGPHWVFAQLGKVLGCVFNRLAKRLLHINGHLCKILQAGAGNAARARHGVQCVGGLARGHAKGFVHAGGHAC